MPDPENEPLQPNPTDSTISDAISLDLINEVIQDKETTESEPEPEQPAPESPEPEKEPTEAPVAENEPAVEKEDKPKPEKPEVKTEEELDAELSEVQPSKNAHPNTKLGFDVLKKKIKAEAATARQLEKERDAARQELELSKGKQLPEDVEKELTDLRQFRRIKAIESDPVFQQKYDGRIQQLEGETVKMLEDWGAKPEIREYIAKNGGVMAVRYSDKLLADGKTTQAEWFKTQILGRVGAKEMDDLDDNIREARQLQRQKQRDIEAAKQDDSKWEEERTNAQKQQEEDWNKRAVEARDNAIKTLGVLAQEWVLKPGAPPEEKEYAKFHNETLKECAAYYSQVIGKHDPEVEVPKAMAASRAIYLSKLSNRLQTRVTELEKQLAEANGTVDKIKNSGRTAKQSNAPAGKISTTPTYTKNDSQMLDSIMDEVLSATK